MMPVEAVLVYSIFTAVLPLMLINPTTRQEAPPQLSDNARISTLVTVTTDRFSPTSWVSS